MVALANSDLNDVKIYTVNGPSSGSSTSLPDWLTRKRATSRKRSRRERVETTLQLVQDFEFPEASMRIKTTKDGHHAIATGVYKPQMRVWDLDQLAMKFERHTDAENIDFVILSDDWTKTLHLQSDRTLELHTQQGFHYRTRLPRLGRALAYHFPSCDAYVGSTGNEVYRLNLYDGRYMTPLVLEGDEGTQSVAGVNAVDINPAHQLLAFGLDGIPVVEFWDPRSKSRTGLLRLPASSLLPATSQSVSLPGLDQSSNETSVSVTALASRSDGLTLAVGTSTGHTLLYDLRSPKPFSIKDQGYGLPIKSIQWIEGTGRGKMAGEGLIMSSDKKVVKIWDQNDPSSNFASATPSNDINYVHHIPSTGLIMLAHEGIELSSLYIPQLGPAPKWCRFLDNITEEMEDQSVRNVYEDYKFVERKELVRLGLDHLVGTPALKPYMHGYFLQLKLYDAARVISNPFAYEEHREKMIKEKMDKLADSRIRTKKGNTVKVNKNLAAKIQREDEKQERKSQRKKIKIANENEAEPEEKERKKEKESLLTDSRFKAIFEDPQFEIDENSRAFSLLNPSTAAAKRKTAVEEEDEQSSPDSSELDANSQSEDSEGEGDSDSGDSDSSEEVHPSERTSGKRYEPFQKPRQIHHPRLVPVEVDSADGQYDQAARIGDKNVSFGQRRYSKHLTSGGGNLDKEAIGGEVSWIPNSERDDSTRSKDKRPDGKNKNPAFTLERGSEPHNKREVDESERRGRSKRRTNIRSGSKNVFRRM